MNVKLHNVPIDDWQREMERYLAHFSRTGKRPSVLFTHTHTHAAAALCWTPAVDMYETDTTLVVLLDLAGVDPERTEVRAEPYLLTIRGVRRERHEAGGVDESRTYHTLEIPYGRFERSMRLPPGIDTDAAAANYRGGLLEITLPKRVPHEVRIEVEGTANTQA